MPQPPSAAGAGRRAAAARAGAFGPVAELLDLPRVLKRLPDSRIAVHDVLRDGLPGSAALGLVGKVPALREEDAVRSVLDISPRSYQRLKADPSRRLSAETSGRLWRFAEVLARATDILGSQHAAERWLTGPAIGLEQRRPIDLMATSAGSAMVEDLLDRMDYGVYG
jgi:putative toxin-antitoxin system antitoxin component (TIGR02293 family)